MENCASIIVLDSNENSREIIKLYIEETGFKGEIKLFGDYNQGIEEIKNSTPAPIVFIDISENHSEINTTIDTVRLFTTKIVITSTDYSTNNIIRAMRLGAKEFLPKPVIKDDLKRVLEILCSTEVKNDDSE